MNKHLNWSCWIALALLSVPVQTQAYYDPAPQRWINRDPVGEPGFEGLKQADIPMVRVAPEDVPDDLPLADSPNSYVFVRNRPTSEIDPFGLFLGFSYGNWCGFSTSGPGAPISEVDAACQKHDYCLATPLDACKFKFCNVRFCRDVARAKCHGDKACKKAKRKILAGCAIIVPIPPFIFM